MTLISEEYKALNSKLHRDSLNFGFKGWQRAKKVYDDFLVPYKLINKDGTDEPHVLDYGCGKGMFAKELYYTYNTYVQCYDPCVERYAVLWDDNQFQGITCLDVLEHIEPENLQSVLDEMKRLGTDDCMYYFNTALVPSNKTLADGRNAHLIVQDENWWLYTFAKAGFQNIRAELESNQDKSLRFLNCILKKR